jgi:hypothetical protein
VPADLVLFKSGFSNLQSYLQLLGDFEMDFPEGHKFLIFWVFRTLINFVWMATTYLILEKIERHC